MNHLYRILDDAGNMVGKPFPLCDKHADGDPGVANTGAVTGMQCRECKVESVDNLKPDFLKDMSPSLWQGWVELLVIEHAKIAKERNKLKASQFFRINDSRLLGVLVGIYIAGRSPEEGAYCLEEYLDSIE